MTIVGFHNSHEQVHPAALLAATQRAEQAGFDAAMCSDHWAPWSVRQGHSGFAWTWLGAALATTGLPFGVVNAPGQRYHPAIIAQAAATLAAMFPGRFWVALGLGRERQRAHHRRPLAGQGRAGRAPAGVRRGHPRAARRRGGHARRAGHGGPGQAVDASRREAAAHRPRGDARDGPRARRLGRRPGHGEPDAGDPASRWCSEYRDAGGRGATEPAGARVVGARRGDRPGRGARADGAARCSARRWRGTWTPRRRSTRSATTSATTPLRRSVLVDHDPARLADRLSELVAIGFDAVYLHQVATDPAPDDEKHDDAAPTSTPRSATLDAFVDMAAEHLLPQLKQVTA